MDTVPIGNISPHETSLEDINVYLHLNNMNYYNYLLFGSSIIQIIFFTGFSPVAPVATGIILYICIKLYLILRVDLVDSDFDYSLTCKELKKVNFVVLAIIILICIDIVLTFTLSLDYIKLILTLKNEYENKFAYFAFFTVLFKLLLCCGLWGWIQYIIGYVAKNNFMIRKETI